jgi:predicted Zn-dependent protease
MITFFEKLEAKEKRKPGAISRAFSTHPLTHDRITEVRELFARFPDRQEYALTTSEFNDIKMRLGSLNPNMRATDRDSKRPTLERRPATSGDTGDSGEQSPKRPTLKGRDDINAETNSEK